MRTTVDNHYNKFSKLYDYGFGIGTLWLMGNMQRDAVKEIGLKKGDTVLDLGCGTGLLFKYLHAEVGDNGKIIGIDITPGMLEKAQDKINKNNWKNIELECADLADENLNIKADAAIFSLCLSLIPDCERVFKESLKLLKKGSAFVVLDSWKKDTRWYHKFTNLYIDIKAPFVYSDPDNKIYEFLPKYLKNITSKDKLMGVYTIVKGYVK